jgi:large subunit ribosomal protein L3
VKALVTRKIGMGSVITDNGAAIAVTFLKATPNVVTQLKTTEVDGYEAVQVGFEETKKPSKPLAGHFKNAKVNPKVVREFKPAEGDELSIGDSIEADIFEIGDTVDATGLTKGKGFAGTIRRHNFHRGRKTHGGRSYRRPGSIGSMFPQRIFPGKKMAGRLGHDRVTTKGLKIALVDKELGVIGVTGSVPGPRKGIVLIKGAK